ncbi:unnamed protein product [Strongylus vulgaris]|uniref:Uncharacterized protein n=1 Tax=Strongylus vulgaris TaxID=40348 RepID=A0A3P7J7H6_STRVU|nr:unnamed protein product [Strongylus vulgaris]
MKSVTPSSKSSSPSVSSSLNAETDRKYAVYGIFLLHGIGMLMSWNMFITIAPQYYVSYWFTVDGNVTHYAESFMSVLGVTSQIPNVGIMFVNMAIVVAGSQIIRIFIPLIINCLLVVVIIALVIFVRPNDDGKLLVSAKLLMIENYLNAVIAQWCSFGTLLHNE